MTDDRDVGKSCPCFHGSRFGQLVALQTPDLTSLSVVRRANHNDLFLNLAVATSQVYHKVMDEMGMSNPNCPR